ncbi:MAG: MarR family transcriptional regulator [Cyanobacteria bacterium REEB67]|nr:MarR family transcriptional regulator [Cyanobacteria bacterium REEB67]
MDKKPTREKKQAKSPQYPIEKGPSAAFLLSQVGAHAASKFGERLAKVNLTPPHAGVLRIVHNTPALTQQALATALGTLPSRLVVLLDDLESKELIERRPHPSDRRSYALYLTKRGEATWQEITAIGKEHQTSLLGGLTPAEQKQLTDLLQKIADEQQLIPHVHPAYRNITQ